MRFTVKYLTEKDYDMCAEIVGESELLYKELRAKGYKVGVFINNTPILLFICAYGSKKNHAYIGELWTNESRLAKRIMGQGIKTFNLIHAGWAVFYHSNVAEKFKRHSIPMKNNMYQYTGTLNVK